MKKKRDETAILPDGSEFDFGKQPRYMTAACMSVLRVAMIKRETALHRRHFVR